VKISEMEARGSKTLVATEPMTQPSWLVWMLMKSIRIVLLTILWAGFGMGVGLFCGIIGIVVWAAVMHRTPEMDLAYRHISVPVAICTGSCAFLWNAGRTLQAGAKRRRAQ